MKCHIGLSRQPDHWPGPQGVDTWSPAASFSRLSLCPPADATLCSLPGTLEAFSSDASISFTCLSTKMAAERLTERDDVTREYQTPVAH